MDDFSSSYHSRNTVTRLTACQSSILCFASYSFVVLFPALHSPTALIVLALLPIEVKVKLKKIF